MTDVNATFRYIISLGALGPFVGCVTALFHITWSLLVAGGLNLSEIYIKYSLPFWCALWAIGTISHITGGMILFYAIKQQ